MSTSKRRAPARAQPNVPMGMLDALVKKVEAEFGKSHVKHKRVDNELSLAIEVKDKKDCVDVHEKVRAILDDVQGEPGTIDVKSHEFGPALATQSARCHIRCKVSFGRAGPRFKPILS